MPQKLATTKRIVNLDILRGIAVILMVQQHTGFWFWNTNGSMESYMSDYPLMVIINGLGGLAAPLFITLAGTGATLYLSNRRESKTLFKRGILVIAFGYTLNALIPSWFSMASWYVLHLIGLGLLLSPIFNRISNKLLFIILTLFIVLSPMVMTELNMPRYLTNESMRNFTNIKDILMLAIISGNFPILPWISLFIMGFIAGKWIISEEKNNIIKTVAILLAIALILFGIKIIDPNFLKNDFGMRLLRINLYMYPAYTLQFIALSSVSLMAIFFIIQKKFDTAFSKHNIVAKMGRISLTIFLLHIILIKNGLIYSGLWKSFTIYQTVFLQILTLTIITILTYFWSKINFKYGFEWILRWVSETKKNN